jgi:hypothetical protein
VGSDGRHVFVHRGAAIEVLPLVLLIIEAIQQNRLIRRHGEFNYRLAYTYVIGAAFWNFVGAGVFGGGTLNAPLINYYEHGTCRPPGDRPRPPIDPAPPIAAALAVPRRDRYHGRGVSPP